MTTGEGENIEREGSQDEWLMIGSVISEPAVTRVQFRQITAIVMTNSVLEELAKLATQRKQ
eukprot:6348678-Prorocentrum_lima.AAC.1